MLNDLKILDTTLRDGEQTPGVLITSNEKLKIALKLDELGVDVIEAGSAITSKDEQKSIKAITENNLSAEICSFARPVKVDIDTALACDVDSIHLVIPSSDLHIQYKLRKTREQVEEMAVKATEYAKSHGLIVELSTEDATRTEVSDLKHLYNLCIDAGADRLCACDTIGLLTPEKSYDFYKELSQLSRPLSVHCHNDFGLAVANTLAALNGGATEAHVTINGLGERAGNASCEELVMAIESLYGIDTRINTELFYETSQLVERISGVVLQSNKAIVGSNAFAHESGIHADGVLKKSETYEPINPEKVGHRRRFILGKHVGKHVIHEKIKETNTDVTDEELDRIFASVKSLSDMGKTVTDVDLQAITDEVLSINPEDSLILEEYTTVSGNKITPTASVKVNINNKEKIEAGVGVGPVDAAIEAIRKSIVDTADITLEEYHVDAVTGGTDALIDVLVKLKYGDKVITSRSTKPDVILASVEAYLKGINKILSDEKRR
ncbi:(R)-citramalate synthase [Methanosphaera sp. WGK6]|uniref:(R)-citramalate synthase n=1 Tax=Methanosphaera sp. WGK6 TaxID=1561964 RepID=UPI00084C904E|nr:(R)-citramalate synthase [Methanosphaera sp. WGK6]OED30622.1 citramalate synthase [Methanosphaera sp. WGK6]